MHAAVSQRTKVLFYNGEIAKAKAQAEERERKKKGKKKKKDTSFVSTIELSPYVNAGIDGGP